MKSKSLILKEADILIDTFSWNTHYLFGFYVKIPIGPLEFTLWARYVKIYLDTFFGYKGTGSEWCLVCNGIVKHQHLLILCLGGVL